MCKLKPGVSDYEAVLCANVANAKVQALIDETSKLKSKFSEVYSHDKCQDRIAELEEQAKKDVAQIAAMCNEVVRLREFITNLESNWKSSCALFKTRDEENFNLRALLAEARKGLEYYANVYPEPRGKEVYTKRAIEVLIQLGEKK
jgi:predicted RNA-binding Zn ribbon-like protein